MLPPILIFFQAGLYFFNSPVWGSAWQRFGWSVCHD